MALALAVACSVAVGQARSASNLFFGFTDDSPMGAGSKATGPALALGAHGFAFSLRLAAGKDRAQRSRDDRARPGDHGCARARA